MAIGAASLVAVVSVQGANAARSQLLSVGAAADSAGAHFGKLAAVGVGALAVGLASVGIASVKMAADFQQGVTRLKTGAGDMTDNMRALGQGILSVSTQTGILTSGTEGLNAAMYLIVSSGQRGAVALDTLKVAAEGAQIEQANVVDVSNALSTAMTDYGTKQFNATQFMNGFIAAVSSGKITLEQLSQAMSPILPVAQKMGVSFADVSSAMSTMTDTGMSADRAATGLRFLMQSLEVPTAKASNAFKEWGVNTQDLANEMRVSLPGALQMIYDAAKRAGPEGSQPFNAAISDMIGGQRSLQSFLDLTGIHLSQFEKNSRNVATAMGLSTTAVKGWDTAQKNFNVQLDKAHATLDAMLIQLGTKLLPILTPMIGQIADVGAAFGKWVSNTDFSGLVETIQGIATQTGNLFHTLGQAATFTMNSQNWKDAAIAIGTASNSVGTFISRLQQAASENKDVAAGIKDAWNGVGDGVKQVADTFAVFGDLGTFLLDKVQNKAISTRAAFMLMGKDANTSMLSLSDATWLVQSGITHVTDAVTGADINLQKYIKTSDLSGSSTVTLAQALTLVGKNSSGFLTAADYAKLLADKVGNVEDMTTGLVTDVKSAADHTGAFLSLAGRQMQQWFDAIKNGSHETFSQFQADLQNKAEKELKATGATADQTRNHLLQLNAPLTTKVDKTAVVIAGQTADQTRAKLIAMNGPYAPVVGNGGTIAAGNTADQTRAKLLAMNGPFSPNVNASSVVAAGNTADETRRRLLALNGVSTWNATINTYQNTYIATIGSGPGNARAAGGLITEPVVGVGLRTGQRWSFGENGDEMVVPMAAPTRAMSGGGGSAAQQQPIHVNVYLDGAPVAKKLMPHIATAIRQATGAKF